MLPVVLLAFTLFASVPVAYGTWCTNSITGFQTVNAFTNEVKNLTIPSGATAATVYLTDFQTCQLNFIATTKSEPLNCDQGQIKCVKITFGNEFRREKVAPYTLYGDIAGSVPFFEDDKPPLDVHTLSACPYTNRACTRRKGNCMEMKVDVKSTPVTPNVTLYDSTKGSNSTPQILNSGVISTLCRPKSNILNFLASVGCDFDEVDFEITDETEGEMNDYTAEYESPYWMYGNAPLQNGQKTYNLYGRHGFQLNREYTLNIYLNGDENNVVTRTMTFNKDCDA